MQSVVSVDLKSAGAQFRHRMKRLFWLPCHCLFLATIGRPLAKLKLIDRLRATCWTPPDYWQTQFQWTGIHSQLPLAELGKPSPNIDLLHTTGSNGRAIFHWPWPTTLIYNPRLAKVKVDPHAKNPGQRSNGSNRRAPTDKQTDTHRRYQTYYLPCYAVDNDVSWRLFYLLCPAFFIRLQHCVFHLQHLITRLQWNRTGKTRGSSDWD